MNNKILLLLVGAAILGGGFYAFNSFIYNEKQADEEVVALAKYFEERMIALGVEDIGQPIEGFDAELLMAAYPGLMPEDFHGVEAFEGRYEFRSGQAEFVRDQTQPVSSAERTVSSEGYVTLYQNVVARVMHPTQYLADVDTLINKIDTES